MAPLRSQDNEFALAICEALGVDPARVTKLVLTCETNEMPTLDVTEVITNDEPVDGDRLVETLARYELKPR